MQQRCWLWLICLIACIAHGQRVSGQTPGINHEGTKINHQEREERQGVEFNHQEREEHEGVEFNHQEREEHEGAEFNYQEREERQGVESNHQEREEHEGAEFNYQEREERQGVEFNDKVGEGHADRLPLLSFAPADSFHSGRFWVATGVTTALYTGSVIALNQAWYKQFPRSSFHFFNDSKEWRYMDKVGHVYTTYFESLWAYKVARWTGMSERPAIWTGAALGLLFQGTVEMLDGFSEEWGFSLTDAGFNLFGSGAFVAQQSIWGEQRILLKVSSTAQTYTDMNLFSTDGESMSSLRKRTDDLFGSNYAERFLKDYNAQTTWLSVNVHSFLHPESKFPRWLNIAIGYGAENMYGGFDNKWEEGDAEFILSSESYPRYSQFYLSPDIDFSRIPCKSPFVRTLLGMLNVFKMPGPVLEMSGEEGLKLKLRW